MSGRPTQVGSGWGATALMAISAAWLLEARCRTRAHQQISIVAHHAGADAADRKTKRIRVVVVGSG